MTARPHFFTTHSHRPRQEGFTLLWLILALFILGLSAQAVFVSVAQQHRQAQKRMQERLVQVYNQAIQSYHSASPGTQKEYPSELSQLLLDTRMIQTRRHLRKLYADPLQADVDPSRAWGMERNALGQIVRIYAVNRSDGELQP